MKLKVGRFWHFYSTLPPLPLDSNPHASAVTILSNLSIPNIIVETYQTSNFPIGFSKSYNQLRCLTLSMHWGDILGQSSWINLHITAYQFWEERYYYYVRKPWLKNTRTLAQIHCINLWIVKRESDKIYFIRYKQIFMTQPTVILCNNVYPRFCYLEKVFLYIYSWNEMTHNFMMRLWFLFQTSFNTKHYVNLRN